MGKANQRILAVDIGGSGMKTQTFNSRLEPEGPAHEYPDPDWADLDRWFASSVGTPPSIMGISCAGFVDTTCGVVRLSRIANWRNMPLTARLEARFPGTRVQALNDAEAHLKAHAGDFSHPLLCVSLGTSLGVALTGPDGRFLRPRPDLNLDAGPMRLPTRASNKEAWWALGSKGLGELQEPMGRSGGARHFGYRPGAFLASICTLFWPSTVVVSGGIAET